jgi:hypothetical protein
VSGFIGKWTVEEISDGKNFLEFCESISSDSNILDVFKTHPHFIPIIGNDIRSNEIAYSLYCKIKNNSQILSNLHKFKTNDNIGSPKLYELPEPFGRISPGTLIFIEELQDISNNLINVFENKLNIVEIGAGYGGLAKIFLDSNQHNYSIIDYPQVLNLSCTYNSKFGNTIMAIPISDISDSIVPDLVVSNWCLSELDDEGIEYYYSKVIRNSKYGYFKMNLWDEHRKNSLINMFSVDFDVAVQNLDEHTPGCMNWKMMVNKK